MNSKAIMIQGTSSPVGKSILCTAICRIFYQDGNHKNLKDLHLKCSLISNSGIEPFLFGIQ